MYFLFAGMLFVFSDARTILALEEDAIGMFLDVDARLVVAVCKEHVVDCFPGLRRARVWR